MGCLKLVGGIALGLIIGLACVALLLVVLLMYYRY